MEIKKKIGQILKSRSSFLIVSHKNPDGDAIGSSLALYRALKEMGKEVYVENPTKPAYTYDFLKDYEIIEPVSNSKDVEVVISVDTAEISRCGLSDGYVKDKLFINIDHHKTNPGFGDINLIEPEASAVGCLVWDILTISNIPISKATAEYLYLSILTDTGSFRYSSTKPKTFRIAADLLERGVEPWFVASNIYESEKLETFKLLSLVLGTLELFYDGRLAIAYVTQEMFRKTNTTADNTEGFVNYARSIRGVEVGILLREDEPDKFKISIRSKGNIDVSDVAVHFNGGGHKNAAGGSIEAKLEDAKKKVIEAFSFLENEK
ncbi:DHH family phosphoesterase [Hippea maritima]|uniref:Phosphoesterase RecJ domain protein n=1 Tax=Hippea maritima (strain ATCC 700847 / DSM 10411 / MH2) TaxID=760142 RepID=F2LVA7_HIPMA|nr:bifunctional oligoribonuclease/PAP phosphatase NrnA [Hippea maritima]AEA33691.1 phosphoesterase RecJ domain protein [Hippea maritima DSM 10411]